MKQRVQESRISAYRSANKRLLFGKPWDNMPSPAQNIFHGMNKTGYFDREYTILEERI